jgi:hypothetical protein
LEDVMIFAIDECDVDGFVCECFRRPQSAKPAADDNDFWLTFHVKPPLYLREKRGKSSISVYMTAYLTARRHRGAAATDWRAGILACNAVASTA